MRVVVFLIAALAVAGMSKAQSFLSIDADPAIPTLQDEIGHAPGEEITSPVDAIAYMEALAAAAPDRMSITPYAESWEGRPLVYAVITSPENMARLDAIKSNIQRLSSGADLSGSARSELIANTPAVVWLSYGVHGDEISSTDAALALSYHLLAARNDATVNKILDETIVIIDPMQNPDGRARFLASFDAARGLEPFADRSTAEHDQPWPGGRFNHYLFDMNRDWFALTQPETVGRVRSMLDWHPLVVVDAHEMGGDETYFFAPSAEPFNPNITAAQKQKQFLIGQNHARWFDSRGYDYFTREVYDAFYPGYGDMWPQVGGAIAMTYEQGSARGLSFERGDGSVLTYKDGVEHHFISTFSTAEVVANNRDVFVGDFAAYRNDAIADGRKASDRYFIFDLADRRWQAEQLARRLAAQDIVVQRAAPGLEACGTRYPKGAIIIDQAQPSGRRIATLLQKETNLPEAFVDEQESRRDRGLNHELYDVTAWSLPLMDGITSRTCARVSLANATPVGPDDEIEAITTASNGYGFAIPWTDTGQARLALNALKEGIAGKTTSEAFIAEGREFPRGTIVFPTAANDASVGARLNTLATEIGAEVVALRSSWVEDGPNFGSDKYATLKLPNVAMLWGEGTSPTETGAARYVIERQLGLPVAPIRVRSIARADLDRYDVIIIPDTGAGFAGRLGGGGTSALKAYVERGGVLIGFGSAVDFLASEEASFLSTRAELAYSEEEAESKDSAEGPAKGVLIEGDDQYEKIVADREAHPEDVPGVLANVIADTDHWLSAGYETAVALYTGSGIYQPLNAAAGTNVFRFAGADEIVASGYLWEENRVQLAYKPFVMAEPHGAGMVIGFTQSPVTRGYLNGLNLLLANAILFGPAHTR